MTSIYYLLIDIAIGYQLSSSFNLAKSSLLEYKRSPDFRMHKTRRKFIELIFLLLYRENYEMLLISFTVMPNPCWTLFSISLDHWKVLIAHIHHQRANGCCNRWEPLQQWLWSLLNVLQCLETLSLITFCSMSWRTKQEICQKIEKKNRQKSVLFKKGKIFA